MKKTYRFLLAVAVATLAFTLSCSSDDGGGDNSPPNTGGGSSSSVGGSQFNPNINYASFTDSRDNKTYKSVVIGSQTWMADNLNYYVPGSKCYGEDGDVVVGNGLVSLLPSEIQANCVAYGRLYDWATAMNGAASSNAVPSGVQGVCPENWHLPSNAEWDELFHHVDGSTGTSSPYNSSTAGKYLKATSGWDLCGPSGSDSPYLCEDAHGFSAMPGGDYNTAGGYFGNVGGIGRWWSATEYNTNNAYYRYMGYKYEFAEYNNSKKDDLFSVRCVKNAP